MISATPCDQPAESAAGANARGRTPATAGAARPVGVAISTPYLPELESLRGIAMLLVFLFHLDALIAGYGRAEHPLVSPVLAYVRAGHSGVNLFFILSAFLLALPFLAAARRDRPVSLRRFAARRALRILPLYYAAVVVASVLSAQQPADVLRGLPYLAFLNAFGDFATPLPPYSNVWWSLATEAQFYLVLPLLPLFLRTRRGRVCGIVVLLLWAAAYAAFLARMVNAPSIAAHIALGVSLFGRLPLFLFGIAAAALYLHRGAAIRARIASMTWARRGGADLALVAVLAALGYLLRWVTWIGPVNEINPPYHAWHLAEGALWTMVVLLLVLTPLALRPLLDNRVLRRLGVLSYSIYILHIPVITLVLAITAGRQPLGGWNARTVLLSLAIAAACVGLAELTYRCIERPFLQRKEHLRG